MSLEIGTLVIPLLAGMDIDQQYSALGSETILRAVSGRGIKQMTYNRMRVTTGGSGWMPVGLRRLISPRSMSSSASCRVA